jgi:hypothetical protein
MYQLHPESTKVIEQVSKQILYISIFIIVFLTLLYSQLIGEQPQLSPVIIDKLPPLTRAMAKMGGLRGKNR